MARLALNRDFSRFLDDETFPHSVKVHIGDNVLTCSGMILAQQSKVMEQSIRDLQGIFKLEEMVDIGNDSQKLDCIKFMYGSPVVYSLQNVDTVIKFASIYEVMDLFHKSVQWLQNNISERNLCSIHSTCTTLENKDHQKKLRKVLDTFISKNADKVGVELTERLCQGEDVDSELFLSVIKQTPANGATLLDEWTNKSAENKTFVLENSDELDFVELFPSQDSFTGFVAKLSANSSSVDVMKQVLALQQNYFMKSASKAAQHQPSSSEQEQADVDHKDEELPVEEDEEKANEDEEEEEGEEEEDELYADEVASVASSASANTTSSTHKPRSRGGRPKRTETWKSNNSNQGKAQGKNQQKGNSGNNAPKFKPPKTTQQKGNVTSKQDPKVFPCPPKHLGKMPSQPPKAANLGLTAKRKVFVSSVPSNATASEIMAPFLFCGGIVNVDVHSHKNIAFVEFQNEQSVNTVLNAAKGGVKFTVKGQAVNVYKYTPNKTTTKPQHNKSSVV